MRLKNVSMNFAHTPGHCGVDISSDGVVLITAGSDTSVRAHDIRGKRSNNANPWWIAESVEEPELPELEIAELHEMPIGALAISPNDSILATGSDDGFVRIFSLSAKENKGGAESGEPSLAITSELTVACARFGGPVRALGFSPTGSFLAAAGDEPGVLKIVMTAQPSNVNILRCGQKEKGMEAVVGLAFDPKSDFVVTIGERGTAGIWSIESGAYLTAVALNEREARSVTWSPDGEKLAIGTNKGTVIVSRNSWVYEYLLTDTGDDEEPDFGTISGQAVVTAVAWSPNMQYLVAGGGDSRVVLWNMQNREVLSTWKAEESIQKVLWHPKENAVIIVDQIGQFGIIPDVVPSHMPPPFESFSRIKLPTLPDSDAVERRSKSVERGDNETDQDDDQVLRPRKSSSRAQRKRDKKKKKKEEVPLEENADAESQSSSGSESRRTFDFGFDDDLDADDEETSRTRKDKLPDGAVYSDSDAGNESSGTEGVHNDSSHRRSKATRRRGRPRQEDGPDKVAVSIHKPFMPSSTPLEEMETKKKRILCWNLTGAVLSFDETTHNIVEVEFADSTRRSVGIKDHFGYSMGCLSTTGVLLGTQRAKAHGSLVYFRPFSSWSSNSDWVQFLPGEENALGLALGQRFAAVGTSPNNLLRIFSLSGIQTDVFGVPGSIVTLAGCGNSLAIIYASSSSGQLRFELLEISEESEVGEVVCTGDVVVSPGSQLEWIGFSQDTKELATYDSKGNLYMLLDSRNAKRWVPLMQNAAALADCDWFWVASVNSDSLIGVPCHSNERYPPAKPRPALRPIPLTAPVIQQAKNGKACVAERFFRSKLKLNRARIEKVSAEEQFDSDDDELAEAEDAVAKLEVETDKCILALMEEACRNEQNLRAFDLSTRLHTKVAFKYAVELATYYKRVALAGRIEEIAKRKIELLEEEEREKLLKKGEEQYQMQLSQQQNSNSDANNSHIGNGSKKGAAVKRSSVGDGKRVSGLLDDVSDDEEEGITVKERPDKTPLRSANATQGTEVSAVENRGQKRSLSSSVTDGTQTQDSCKQSSKIPKHAPRESHEKKSVFNRFKKIS